MLSSATLGRRGLRNILREDQGGGQGKRDIEEEVIGWRGGGSPAGGKGVKLRKKQVKAGVLGNAVSSQ